MSHICYHLVSENHNEFLNVLDEVRSSVKNWKSQGDKHIKVFKITTEDLGSDAISLDENELVEEE